MKIDSTKVIVNASQQNIFDFLTDSNNIKELLPQDKISDFKSDKNQCSFKVQGGVIISLIQDGNDGLDVIKLKSGEGTPFPFKLLINITPQGDQCEGFIHFDGEVNMFLKMMVEKPLTNLFNYMSNKLQEKFK
jgi:carbon monoxide dehydrogenase subunit G